MHGTNLTNPRRRPLRLTHRHHRIVELAVLGATNNEIARSLGYTAARVSQLVNHPEILALIEQTRLQYRERSLGTLHDDLEHDARNTFDKLKTHRDHEDPDVSLRACGMLWDRQIPKRTINDETHVTKLIIERREIRYLKQVADEDDAPFDEGTMLDGPPAAD